MLPLCSSKNAMTRQAGQVVVEYVLLLSIGVGIAILITTQLVKKDPAEPGAIIAKWQEIRKFIAEDDPGKR